MHISSFDYGIWFSTVFAEISFLVALRRRPSPVGRAIRVYLRVQVLLFVVLLPVTCWGDYATYFACYVVGAVFDFAAQFLILSAIFKELRGSNRVFGSLRRWAGMCAGISLALSACAIIAAPKGLTDWCALWSGASQILTYAANLGALVVALYGWVIASSWPRRLALAWTGFALYVGTSFIAERLNLLSNLRFSSVLHQVPTVAFFGALALWGAALAAEKGISTSQQTTVLINSAQNDGVTFSNSKRRIL